MAEIAFTRSKVGAWDVFTWASVTESDTFASVRVEGPVYAATVQFSGTFGGATVVMQGSNDDSTFLALDDVEDIAISHTAAGGSELRHAWPYMRPSASGGTSQSLTAIMAVQIQQQ